MKKKIDVFISKSYYTRVIKIKEMGFGVVSMLVNSVKLFNYPENVLGKVLYLLHNFMHYNDTEIILLFFRGLILIIPTNIEYDVIPVHGKAGLVDLSGSDIEQINKIIRLSNIRQLIKGKVNSKTVKGNKTSLKVLEEELTKYVEGLIASKGVVGEVLPQQQQQKESKKS